MLDFKNKVACVFGGTGTIGSLIVEYLLDQHLKGIRIFSNDENSLWECQQKWNYGKDNNLRYLLGDIRDLERVKKAVNKCDFVFNCAAIKHIPFSEYNPLEAVSVNIIGLDNIISACVEKSASKLLHISTDKVVNNTTVMGATKLICERILQIRWAQNPTVKMVCTRLGNVYGSRGSIVLVIKNCVKQQKPVPLTDLNVLRYFMQPSETIDFIVKSFEEGGNGEIFIPKLKETRIIDVICKEAGERYPYQIVGLRKGEKLKEELISEEELKFAEEHEDKWIIRNDILL